MLTKVSSADYHAHPAVGHSGLVRLMRSPAHYRAWLECPPEPSAAMQFGSAFHMALLEPELFAATFVVAPRFDRRTKEGKQAAEAWEAANGGKTPLTEDQMAAIEQMVANVKAHLGAAGLLANGMAELSGFWTDDPSGVACKCRPDFLTMVGEKITAIVDVKTSNNAGASDFSRSIAVFGYDVQTAFYVDGVKAITGQEVPFFFIAVEKEPPYAVAVYQASEAMIEVGRAKYRAALELLRWCKENDCWPSYQPNGVIEIIDLPRWAANFDLGE